MTEEERERLTEEREQKKEELRREKEEQRLAEERRARREALSNVAEGLFHHLSRGAHKGKKAAEAAAEAAKEGFGFKSASFSALKKAAGAVVNGFEKVWRALVDFSQKKWSVPLFILFTLVVYVVVARFFGYKVYSLQVHPLFYQFFLADYSVGFCSRLFVGAVITLFTDRISTDLMNQIVTVSVIVSLLFQACIAGFLLRTALKKSSWPAVVMAFAFVFNPLVIADKMTAPGMVDIFQLLVFFLWLAFLKTPAVVLVTPVLCLVGMSIHYCFLFNYLPPMLVLLFYYSFFGRKKSTRVLNGIGFWSGSAVSASSFLYFVFFAQNHLKMTSEQFYQHMLSKFDQPYAERELYTAIMGAPIYREYYDYYIFGEFQGDNYMNDFSDFFSFLRNWTVDHFHASDLMKDMALFLPVWIFAAIIWSRCATREKGIRKLPYICFVGQAIVLIPELFISTDSWRWVSAALISQLVVFSVLYFDKDSPLHSVTDGKRIFPYLEIFIVLGIVYYAVLCGVLL